MHDRKPVTDIDDSGRVKCIRDTCIIHEFSISGDENNIILYDGQLVASDSWIREAYSMDKPFLVPREPAEVNITTVSETLQV